MITVSVFEMRKREDIIWTHYLGDVVNTLNLQKRSPPWVFSFQCLSLIEIVRKYLKLKVAL